VTWACQQWMFHLDSNETDQVKPTRGVERTISSWDACRPRLNRHNHHLIHYQNQSLSMMLAQQHCHDHIRFGYILQRWICHWYKVKVSWKHDIHTIASTWRTCKQHVPKKRCACLPFKNTSDQRMFTAESDKDTGTESEPTKMVMYQGMPWYMALGK